MVKRCNLSITLTIDLGDISYRVLVCRVLDEAPGVIRHHCSDNKQKVFCWRNGTLRVHQGGSIWTHERKIEITQRNKYRIQLQKESLIRTKQSERYKGVGQIQNHISFSSPKSTVYSLV
jgi:hypothetical protein